MKVEVGLEVGFEEAMLGVGVKLEVEAEAEVEADAEVDIDVDVGRKERLAAEATLASEITLCFDMSSGRGPSGTLCCSRTDSRRPLRPVVVLLPSTGAGRGADVGFEGPAVGLRSLLSLLLVVRWNLRRTRPSVEPLESSAAELFLAMGSALSIVRDGPGLAGWVLMSDQR